MILQKRTKSRRDINAFSAIEIMISIVVLACALIPILTLMSSGKKSAVLTEYHVLAQMRARRVVETISAYPFKELMKLPASDTGGVKIPGSMVSTAFPAEYENKVKNYEEFLFLENLEEGITLATIIVKWTLATGENRSYELCRIFCDESVGLNGSYPLRQEGAG